MAKAIIMSGYGINSEKESAFAFEKAGAVAEIVHINDLISKKKALSDYDILMFPGGFSYGDDTGSGQAFAGKVKNNLWDDLMSFIGSGKLILGVCNGFQIMVHLGLFPGIGGAYGTRSHALMSNCSARFECRDVFIKGNSKGCVFTKGITTAHLPVCHGEGRFYCKDETLEQLKKNSQIVFTYCDSEGRDAAGAYPKNPNGSLADIAGICDRTGRIMGMMPHPERALFTTSLPDFHLNRELARRAGSTLPEFVEDNLLIFKNAVEYIDKNCIKENRSKDKEKSGIMPEEKLGKKPQDDSASGEKI
ncbi:phosphoribosylformylglycinamidine synthase I [Candidatus Woesearchaeota archaeon]|nr:phosphoribosylformylglycinamidine synthase I [Candidatus Woesearchaeota archaeon]